MSPFPRKRLLATLVAGCCFAAAAIPSAALAVVNGSSVQNDGDFPWTVAIVTAGEVPSVGQFCGGTLIAPDRVLTAAHCIDPAGPNQARPDSLDVLVGQTSLSGTGCVGDTCVPDTKYRAGSRFGVRAISLHSRAEVTHFRYDVAILTLDQPVVGDLAKAIVAPVTPAGADQIDVPIPSPAADETLQGSTTPDAWGAAAGASTGTDAFVFGWGGRYANDGSPPNVLRFAGGTGLERLSDSLCAQRYSGQFSADDMVCAGRVTIPAADANGNYSAVEDACQGDSGGPLLKRAPVQDFPQSLVESYRPGHSQTQVETFARALVTNQVASYQKFGRHWRIMGVVSFGVGCGDPRKPGVYARVGAPQLYDYIQSPAPVSMPQVDLARGPRLSGEYGADREIACDPGSWSDAASFEYMMWRDTNGDGKRGSKETPLTGTSATGRYRVQTADLSAAPAPIGCSVIARGGGGYASAEATPYTPPIVAATPPATGTPPATPATTPSAAEDRFGPVVSKSSSVCSASTCRVAVVILDPGHGAAGVKSVAVTLTIARRVYYRVKSGPSKGKLRSRVTTIRKTVAARRSIDQWVVNLKGLRKGDKPKLSYEATDRSGNTGRLTVVLKLRPKK